MTEKHQTTSPRGAIKAGVALATLAGLVVAGGETGFWGAAGHTRSQAEQLAIARATFTQEFQHASPAMRFAMMYNGMTQINVKTQSPGKGIIGSLTHERLKVAYVFGQSCLSNTPYDTSPNAISGGVSGFLVSGNIEGKSYTPAGVVIDPHDSDRLKVVSGNSQLPILEFTGVTSGEELKPADPVTLAQLGAYACVPSIPEAILGTQ